MIGNVYPEGTRSRLQAGRPEDAKVYPEGIRSRLQAGRLADAKVYPERTTEIIFKVAFFRRSKFEQN